MSTSRITNWHLVVSMRYSSQFSFKSLSNSIQTKLAILLVFYFSKCSCASFAGMFMQIINNHGNPLQWLDCLIAFNNGSTHSLHTFQLHWRSACIISEGEKKDRNGSVAHLVIEMQFIYLNKFYRVICMFEQKPAIGVRIKLHWTVIHIRSLYPLHFHL